MKRGFGMLKSIEELQKFMGKAFPDGIPWSGVEELEEMLIKYKEEYRYDSIAFIVRKFINSLGKDGVRTRIEEYDYYGRALIDKHPIGRTGYGSESMDAALTSPREEEELSAVIIKLAYIKGGKVGFIVLDSLFGRALEKQYHCMLAKEGCDVEQLDKDYTKIIAQEINEVFQSVFLFSSNKRKSCGMATASIIQHISSFGKGLHFGRGKDIPTYINEKQGLFVDFGLTNRQENKYFLKGLEELYQLEASTEEVLRGDEPYSFSALMDCLPIQKIAIGSKYVPNPPARTRLLGQDKDLVDGAAESLIRALNTLQMKKPEGLDSKYPYYSRKEPSSMRKGLPVVDFLVEEPPSYDQGCYLTVIYDTGSMLYLEGCTKKALVDEIALGGVPLDMAMKYSRDEYGSITL